MSTGRSRTSCRRDQARGLPATWDRRGRSSCSPRRDAEAGRRAGEQGRHPGRRQREFRVDLSAPTGGAGLLRGTGYGLILDDDEANPPVIGLAVVSDNARTGSQWVNPLWSTYAEPILVRFKRSGAGCSAADDRRPRKACGILASRPSRPRRAQLHADLTRWRMARSTATRSSWTTGTSPGDRTPRGCRPRERHSPTPRPGQVEVLHRPPARRSLAPPALHMGGGARPVERPPRARDGARARGGRHLARELELGQPRLGGPGPLADRDPRGRAADVPDDAGRLGPRDPRRHGRAGWDTQIGERGVHRRRRGARGIFTAYGGAWSYILVGTRLASGNRFYALDPVTGAVFDYYPQVGDPLELGAVTSMATVDYALGQVYFATFSTRQPAAHAVVPQARAAVQRAAVRLGAPEVRRHSRAGRPRARELRQQPGAPRGERLYVVNKAGRLWAIDRRERHILSCLLTATGDIKGFPCSDRTAAATSTSRRPPGTDNVWAVTTWATMCAPAPRPASQKWKNTAFNPSCRSCRRSEAWPASTSGTQDVDTGDRGRECGLWSSARPRRSRHVR